MLRRLAVEYHDQCEDRGNEGTDQQDEFEDAHSGGGHQQGATGDQEPARHIRLVRGWMAAMVGGVAAIGLGAMRAGHGVHGGMTGGLRRGWDLWIQGADDSSVSGPRL